MSNEELDALVLSIVAGLGPIKNSAIVNHDAVQARVTRHPRGVMRSVDGALQRLRKAGKIAPGPKGWTLTERRACSRCKGSGVEPKGRK